MELKKLTPAIQQKDSKDSSRDLYHQLIGASLRLMFALKVVVPRCLVHPPVFLRATTFLYLQRSPVLLITIFL